MITTLASAWSSEKAMIGGIEPRVERVEHGLAHRHAVVAFEHRRRVGEKDRHRVAAPDAALGQRRGELARARVELAITAPQRPVDDRGVVGKDRGRALEKAERRQRLVVGRVAVEIGVVWRFRHSCVPVEDVSEDEGGSQCGLKHRPHICFPGRPRPDPESRACRHGLDSSPPSPPITRRISD